ncbi:MAG: OmpH family outer membrane protein [Alistipes sp.]|jgi:outer membrane protein|nr:OmpH family outer membrane protein [Alistipes sp.]MBQ1957592.1 OmpH family outer membrane protein [Alistipes sp.]MBQ1981233.1 OmpH family outer membrane protein [Alistipes sp.]MBQ2415131.1 OmpH family outer membrane protein [Alistipes sp.]MBQ5623504.1 OmpH family outer membrane protein [Alistipes sp.]
MRRFILVLALVLGLSFAASAQNYALVNSEKIFKSIESYNTAISELDKMAQEYQAEVDEKFKAVENLYNAYMQRKSQLSEASQAANEENIIKKEQEATEFQESIFGTDGELMKKRLELIQPIQKLVFSTIEEYAKAKGYDMVIDISQNATMLYYSPKADHTEAIIAELKKKENK